MSFLLFPNQLFELKYIPKKYHKYNFYLLEHPKFYGLTKNNIINEKMNFNKKKIILHKASCLSYINNMKNKINIIYTSTYPLIKNNEIIIFDLVDDYLMEEINKNYKNNKITILDSPNFITSKENLKKYYEDHKNKNYIHSSFYKFQLKIHNIPYIKLNKSYDIHNRNAIPLNTDLTKLSIKKLNKNNINNKNKFLNEGKKFVEDNFKNNYGSSEIEEFYIPITHKEAKIFFNNYLHHRMQYFAIYQDAIVPEELFLYHSAISSIINIGLINPKYIVEKLIKMYDTKKITLQNYEAYIRQIIGWREYQRFIYIYLKNNILNVNYFNNKRLMTKHWYHGTLGIPPVDDAIKMAFKYGYIHHILRLMVMCNFMNLCNLNPNEVYKWFMEFSTDSYEWVMVGNVYSMGLWSDGGITMRKPYISTDNYINEMSKNRYIKENDEEWQVIWKSLYYNFLMKNKNKLRKTIYNRNIKYLNKMDNEEKKNIKRISELFINKITK